MSSMHRVLLVVAASVLWQPVLSAAAADSATARTPPAWSDLRGGSLLITGDAQAGHAEVDRLRRLPRAARPGHRAEFSEPGRAIGNLSLRATENLQERPAQRPGHERPGRHAERCGHAQPVHVLRLVAAKAGGSLEATARGGQLFFDGDPARGVPPCQGCHGPAGRGGRAHTPAMRRSRGPGRLSAGSTASRRSTWPRRWATSAAARVAAAAMR